MNVVVRTPFADEYDLIEDAWECADALGISGTEAVAEALAHLDSLSVPGTIISYSECESLRQSLVGWLYVLALAAEIVAVAWLALA